MITLKEQLIYDILYCSNDEQLVLIEINDDGSETQISFEYPDSDLTQLLFNNLDDELNGTIEGIINSKISGWFFIEKLQDFK